MNKLIAILSLILFLGGCVEKAKVPNGWVSDGREFPFFHPRTVFADPGFVEIDYNDAWTYDIYDGSISGDPYKRGSNYFTDYESCLWGAKKDANTYVNTRLLGEYGTIGIECARGCSPTPFNPQHSRPGFMWVCVDTYEIEVPSDSLRGRMY